MSNYEYNIVSNKTIVLKSHFNVLASFGDKQTNLFVVRPRFVNQIRSDAESESN